MQLEASFKDQSIQGNLVEHRRDAHLVLRCRERLIHGVAQCAGQIVPLGLLALGRNRSGRQPIPFRRRPAARPDDARSDALPLADTLNMTTFYALAPLGPAPR